MVACVNVAENNLKEQRRVWENSALAIELIGYAKHSLEFEHMVNIVYSVTERMVEALLNHPRLSLLLMKVQLNALNEIENSTGHYLGITEDLRSEISRYTKNIAAADKGDFDSIVQESLLKHDPIEWTKQWEMVIDEVDKIVDERLAEHPRGMGFCHRLWYERAAVLKDFGIEWRSPDVMNPGVMFD